MTNCLRAEGCKKYSLRPLRSWVGIAGETNRRTSRNWYMARLLMRSTAVSRSVQFVTPVVRPEKSGTHSENQCLNSITTMNCMALIVNIIFVRTKNAC